MRELVGYKARQVMKCVLVPAGEQGQLVQARGGAGAWGARAVQVPRGEGSTSPQCWLLTTDCWLLSARILMMTWFQSWRLLHSVEGKEGSRGCSSWQLGVISLFILLVKILNIFQIKKLQQFLWVSLARMLLYYLVKFTFFFFIVLSLKRVGRYR